MESRTDTGAGRLAPCSPSTPMARALRTCIVSELVAIFPPSATPTATEFIRNGALILSGNTLYGAASYAGISGAGTVFAVNTDGTGFAILHSFSYDSEGGGPSGGFFLSGS